MINGYVTMKELEIITGYSAPILRNLINLGLKYHEIEVLSLKGRKSAEKLFNLEEVCKWLQVHIF